MTEKELDAAIATAEASLKGYDGASKAAKIKFAKAERELVTMRAKRIQLGTQLEEFYLEKRKIEAEKIRHARDPGHVEVRGKLPKRLTPEMLK